MTEEKAIKAQKRKRRRKRAGYGLWGLAKLTVLLVAVGLLAFALSGKPFKAPDWMQVRILEQLNSVVSDGDVQFQGIALKFSKGLQPTVTVEDLVLSNASGVVVAYVSSASASLLPTALIKGEVRPTDVSVQQATINLRRAKNGEFDLGFGVNVGEVGAPTETIGEVLDSIDLAFEAQGLSTIESIELSKLTLNFSDARARRGWLLTDGTMRLVQDAQKVGISLGFDLDYGAEQPATAEMTFETQKGSTKASFGATVSQVAARDLASQFPALAWLGVLDAPISGAIRAQIGENGLLGDMNGTLEIGQGSLRPTDDARAFGFTSARAYFGFDPVAQKIRFDELSVHTEAGLLKAEGQAYLRELTDGIPKVMLGQLRILEGLVQPEGVFAAPVAITGGAADLRLRLDPFVLTIGQAVVEDAENSYLIKGDIKADKTGWHVAMDAKANEITPDRLIALWPLAAIPNTRRWIDENVNSARIFNVNGSLRVNTDQKPIYALGYEFDGADVRYLNSLPPVKGGFGHGAIAAGLLTVVANGGQVTAPEGGALDVAGTVFQIPHIGIKGPPAVVSLKARGPIHAALSLLDQKPFEVLSKARLPVDLATGVAEISGKIKLRLVKKILIDDVDYDVAATLSNVRSDKLVEGRVVTAENLAVTATPSEVVISGASLLGDVPVQGSWVQKMGPENAGKSRLEGTVELSQRFVDEFGIGLPKGSVTGAGLGRVEIDLRRGQASRFKMVSDLNRVGLRLSDLGWSLPKNGKGLLEVSGTLGTPPNIERLVINGAGLKATGNVTLTPAGDLRSARFSRVQLAGWLDAPIELIGRGRGATPSVKISGGSIDTRKTTFGNGDGTTTGAGGALTVALDRLVVSEGITLTGFRGNFTRLRGFTGDFTARLNGKAPISGVVVPTKGGSSFRIKSKDAGAVFKAAGVLDTGRDGTMDLTLIPRSGYEGQYDGRLTGENVRIRGAPAMADLLGAISGVGLLEQLNGKGIVFTNYQVRFRLTPRQVIITSGSAVGASLGVSMDGVYNLGVSTLDMQGVLSPIYFLNGIGQILTRKGEGLFGFNYRMTGKASDPKVRVNPLSILTPGMFRELFKRQPPKVEGAPTRPAPPAPTSPAPTSPEQPTPPARKPAPPITGGDR